MYSSPLSPAGLPFLLWREAGFRLRNVFSGSRAAWAQALGRNFREAAQVRQLRRQPLVSDPREAIRSFYCAAIDALAIGDFLIVK